MRIQEENNIRFRKNKENKKIKGMPTYKLVSHIIGLRVHALPLAKI